MSYPIGVDLGATFTAAAVCTADDVEVTPVGAQMFIPTVAAVTQDGSLMVGDDVSPPSGSDRVARQFIRRVGDKTPLLLGGVPITAEVLAARFVSSIVDTVTSSSGEPAGRAAITYPASWRSYRVEALRSALSAEGLGEALLLPGPSASAQAYADRAPVAAGDLVAVYDLGGSGLDAAVVRRLATGEFALAGRAEEVEVGGLDFDELVFDHVRAALGEQWTALNGDDPAVLAGVARLRRACTAAKEHLSTDTEAWVPVDVPGIDAGRGGSVRLVRAEFEEMIQPAVEETAAALLRAISSAGAEPDDLAAVLLTGGSARIPLVTQVVSELLGRPVTVAERPKADTAVGAALVAAGRTMIADLPVVPDAPVETRAEPTVVLPRVVSDPEEGSSPARLDGSPPAPPRGAASAAPRPPRWRARHRHASPRVLAGGVAALAAILVGGWLWLASAGGSPGVDANVKNPLADQTALPSSAVPAQSPTPGPSPSRTRPGRRQQRSSPRPATSSGKAMPSPTRSPAGVPKSPSRSSTPSPTPPRPTTTSTSPLPSTSPSPTPAASPAQRLLPILSLLE